MNVATYPQGIWHHHSQENIEDEKNRKVGNSDLRILVECMEMLYFRHRKYSENV